MTLSFLIIINKQRYKIDSSSVTPTPIIHVEDEFIEESSNRQDNTESSSSFGSGFYNYFFKT